MTDYTYLGLGSPLKKGTGSEPTRENRAENSGCEVPDTITAA